MVAPFQKNPPKINVQTFARPSAKVTPASGRVKPDRAAAKTWGAVSETVSADFARLARVGAADAWYAALSPEAAHHWIHHYPGDVTEIGLSARRIPRRVTEALAAAIRHDCFTEYVVWTNTQKQYVLLGVVEARDEQRLYPIAAWYPAKSPLPTSEELKEMSDAWTATREREYAAAAKDRQVAAARTEEERRQARMLGRAYWMVASAVLGVMNLAVLLLSWKWGVGSAFITAIGARLVFEANDGYLTTVAAVRKRLSVSFAVLCVIVGVLLGVAAL